MHRLENLHQAPMASPRRRKSILFPPIEVNNKSTGLLAKTIGSHSLDQRRTSPFSSSSLLSAPKQVGVLTGADVFAAPPPKTLRRRVVIGTPPPRASRRNSHDDLNDSGVFDGSYPSIRVSSGGQDNNAKISRVEETPNNPFVPIYSSDFKNRRPVRISTTEVNDDSDESDSDFLEKDTHHHRQSASINSRRLTPLSWKSENRAHGNQNKKDSSLSSSSSMFSTSNDSTFGGDLNHFRQKLRSSRANRGGPTRLQPLKSSSTHTLMPLKQHKQDGPF